MLTDPHLDNAPIMVFTGDSLFMGDVGRIDLYGSKKAPEMAAQLYHSLFRKILSLGDSVLLYPAHGGGSVCGKNISEREESTLGFERPHNPLLQIDKDDFIRYKVAEKHDVPPYFKQMEKYNLEGPPLLGSFPQPSDLTPP